MSRSALFAQAVAAHHEARSAWLDLLEVEYLRAEKATRGHLLNARGRELGIDPRTLFYGSAVRAAAYASEELIEHWSTFPRLPWGEFEAAFAAERDRFCPACRGAA